MVNQTPQLKDGAEWAEHEDCIIGDEAGLKNLIDACQTALEKGEYYGDGLGEYVGVKKIDSSWFKDPLDSPKTRFANFCLAISLLALVAFTIVGFVTTLKWFF